MSQFQSMFDVDTDAMRTASYDSVFDDSEEAAKNFDNIFGAEEDDRLMESVINVREDGTDLPDNVELHNNEEDILGDDNTTAKNFGDGIFDDETDNAPDHDTSDLDDVIDRTKGAEGTKDVLDLGCDKTGVQDGGQCDADDLDPEHLFDDSEDEITSAKKDYDFHQETVWMDNDDIFNEDSLDIEGTDDVTDIGDGIQDNGEADYLDDDQVEHLEDESERETKDAAKSYGESVDDIFGFGEDADLGSDDLGMPNDTDGEGGLPDKDEDEGEVPDANEKFQDDLDESFLFEDADEDSDADKDDDEDSDSDEEDTDDLGSNEDDEEPSFDDDDDADKDEDQDDLDESANFLFEDGEVSDDIDEEDDDDTFDEAADDFEDGEQDLDVSEEEQAKESDSVDESYLFEDDQIEDELNGVVDDEDRRDGYESAVDHFEGEDAPADDLDESAFLFEDADADDSEIDEAIDDDAVETVENNNEDGDGDVDLDYDASDDAIFDDVNAE